MKLTTGILIKLGFRGEGRDIVNNPAYRFKVPRNEKMGYYHYQIQVVLNDKVSDDNCNSGTLSLYSPAIHDAHMLVEERDNKVKADFIEWEDTENNLRGGIKYIDIPERAIPIAWHVNTLERLNEIYVALTGNPPFVYTEPPKRLEK